jgi:hypothetical protein
MNNDWFDEKYKEGGRPTLEDEAELIRQLEIPLADRAKGKVVQYIREALFQLKRGYSPSADVLAHCLIFSPFGVSCMPESERREFVRQYLEIIGKYDDANRINRNFE